MSVFGANFQLQVIIGSTHLEISSSNFLEKKMDGLHSVSVTLRLHRID